MSTKETKTKVTSKRVLLPALIGGIVASAILAGMFIVYPAISSVYAVQPFNTTTTADTLLRGSQIPKITGSINVLQSTNNITKDKISFSQAADIAGKQVANGAIVGGHLGVVRGYIVYTFFGVNLGTHRTYFTIIDAGNGKVLYTSSGQQIGGEGLFGPFGLMRGPFTQFGPYGLAAGFGHGPFAFGYWSTPGGFMNAGGRTWH